MHPILSSERLDNKGTPDPRCVEMREKLDVLLKELAVLDDSGCTAEKAAKAWDTLFGTSYFRGKIEEGAKATIGFASSSDPGKFERGDGGRYG